MSQRHLTVFRVAVMRHVREAIKYARILHSRELSPALVAYTRAYEEPGRDQDRSISADTRACRAFSSAVLRDGDFDVAVRGKLAGQAGEKRPGKKRRKGEKTGSVLNGARLY